jgi:flagellar biosynthesis/type III secretory pathway protein FliH
MPLSTLEERIATTDFERLIFRMYRKDIEKAYQEGYEEGRKIGRAFCVTSAFKNGKSALEISDFFALPLEEVKTIIEEYLKSEPLKS